LGFRNQEAPAATAKTSIAAAAAHGQRDRDAATDIPLSCDTPPETRVALAAAAAARISEAWRIARRKSTTISRMYW